MSAAIYAVDLMKNSEAAMPHLGNSGFDLKVWIRLSEWEEARMTILETLGHRSDVESYAYCSETE